MRALRVSQSEHALGLLAGWATCALLIMAWVHVHSTKDVLRSADPNGMETLELARLDMQGIMSQISKRHAGVVKWSYHARIVRLLQYAQHPACDVREHALQVNMSLRKAVVQKRIGRTAYLALKLDFTCVRCNTRNVCTRNVCILYAYCTRNGLQILAGLSAQDMLLEKEDSDALQLNDERRKGKYWARGMASHMFMMPYTPTEPTVRHSPPDTRSSTCLPSHKCL